MASFPASIVSPTDPTANDHQNSPSHSQQHQSHNAEIVATETKIGTGSSTPAANKILYATGTGTSAWQGLTSAQLLAILSDETGSGAVVFGTAPTISAPVLTTPAIITSINDASGNEVIKTPATASAVNEFTITNAATGTNPVLSATGNDAVISPNIRGKGLAGKVTIGVGAAAIYPYDYVVSGCVWTADNVGVNLNASMTAGVVVINSNPITVALVTARAFTTNVDTYIDVLDNGDGTGLLVYTTVATNAASQALASNSIRIGIIQAAATITATTKVNQGQEDRVFPIASSIPYAVTDSLGNLICPRDPNRKILGYRQITANVTFTTIAQVTGLTCPVIVPTGRKVKISAYVAASSNPAISSVSYTIWDGVVNSGIQLELWKTLHAIAANNVAMSIEILTTPAAISKTYNLGGAVDTNTETINASATQPAWIKVELA